MTSGKEKKKKTEQGCQEAQSIPIFLCVCSGILVEKEQRDKRSRWMVRRSGGVKGECDSPADKSREGGAGRRE